MFGAIATDENVAFYWCLAAVDMDTSTANALLHDMDTSTSNALLHDIVELWVKIRGYSFCSGCMELYKEEAQISLQRSKGLQKTLLTEH